MLCLNCFQVVFYFIVMFLSLTSSQRRILNGKPVAKEDAKRYMVYLMDAAESKTGYDSWLCGGAIVSPDFIVTSAACVEDVSNIYAVAGSLKYIKEADVEKNECAKLRKKITLICVPKDYEFSYTSVEHWANIDIAAVKVDTPYNFDDPSGSYSKNCDFVPNKIDINYDPQFQKENTDCMVFGWGHAAKFRKPLENEILNQETLHYSPIKLANKQVCVDAYKEVPQMETIIHRYMLCAWKDGNIDSGGRQIVKKEGQAEGCEGTFVRIGGLCQDPDRYREFMAQNPHLTNIQKQSFFNESKLQYEIFLEQNKRYQQLYQYEQYKQKQQAAAVEINPEQGFTFDDAVSITFRRNSSDSSNVTRRAGICQNDHGGPLITWVGGHEVLIGVASVFLLNLEYDCTGPFLFTSTLCNGLFLECVIFGVDPPPKNVTSATRSYSQEVTTKNKHNDVTSTTTKTPETEATSPMEEKKPTYMQFRRNPACDLPAAERGFEIIERRVVWDDNGLT